MEMSYRDQLQDHRDRITDLEAQVDELRDCVGDQAARLAMGDPAAIDHVLKAVCWAWQVDLVPMLAGRRTQSMANALGCIVKILRDRFGMSFEEIGDVVQRDHSSVMYALKMHDMRRFVADASPDMIQRWATLYEEHGATRRDGSSVTKRHMGAILKDQS
jgi:hypothetical protein